MPREKHWKDIRRKDRILGKHREQSRWKRKPHAWQGSGNVGGNPRSRDSRATDNHTAIKAAIE